MKKILMAMLLGLMVLALCSCGDSSSSSGGSRSNGGSKGYGGYDMPNSSDESLSDYIQRVDPDLWDSMEDRWNSMGY